MRYNILLCVLLMLIPSAIFGQNVNFQGGAKDAMISSGADTLNYGASKVTKVGRKDSTDTLRFLYQSDVILARIPPGASIDSVVFKLYQCSTSTDTSIGAGWLYIKSLDSIFAEGTQTGAKDTVNWKRKQHATESNVTAWKTAGGDFGTTKIDSQAFTKTTDSIAFHDDSLDALVQRWVNGTQSNRGFIITSSAENKDSIWVFATSDSTGRQPRWEIWYTIASPSWSKKYLSQDSSGKTDWIPDDDVSIGHADTATYAENAVTPSIVDTARVAFSADTIGTHPADSTITAAQLDSGLATLPDSDEVSALIFDSTHVPIDTSEIVIAEFDEFIQDHQSDSARVAGQSDSASVSGYADSSAAAFKSDTTLNGTPYADRAYRADSTTGGAPYADRSAYSDSSGKAPIATGAVRGTVKIGSGLNVTADGTITVAGSGGSAYADSIVKDAVRVSGDSIATEEQLVNSIGDSLDARLTQANINIPFEYSADTSLTIAASDSMDVFYDVISDEKALVARAKTSATGIQNITFQTIFEIPKTISSVDTLTIWFQSKDASADSNKVNAYAGTQARSTGTITLTDSSVNNVNTTLTAVKLTLSDNGIVGGNLLVVRFRVWSLHADNWVWMKRIYLSGR